MAGFTAIAPAVSAMVELVEIDARLSWIPPGRRGFEPFNMYMVESEEALLLVDTGVALHRAQLLAAVAERLRGRRLVVLNTRSELDCIGNLGAVLDSFDNVQLVTSCPLNPFDLVHRRQPQRVHGPVTFLAFGDTLEDFGFPHLRSLRPAIRMLGTGWLHDEASGVLFCSDCFGADLLAGAEEPPIRTGLAGAPDGAALRASMLAKFDWLASADRPALRKVWDALFGRIGVTALAPSHGRIQLGAEVAGAALAEYRRVLLE